MAQGRLLSLSATRLHFSMARPPGASALNAVAARLRILERTRSEDWRGSLVSAVIVGAREAHGSLELLCGQHFHSAAAAIRCAARANVIDSDMAHKLARLAMPFGMSQSSRCASSWTHWMGAWPNLAAQGRSGPRLLPSCLDERTTFLGPRRPRRQPSRARLRRVLRIPRDHHR